MLIFRNQFIGGAEYVEKVEGVERVEMESPSWGVWGCKLSEKDKRHKTKVKNSFRRHPSLRSREGSGVSS